MAIASEFGADHVVPESDRKPLVFVGVVVVLGAMALAYLVFTYSDATVARCSDDLDADHSVARMWNEAALDAIRRDLPAPTVHSRNLFHLSAAMWDAWAAYDEDATAVFVHEDVSAQDIKRAREEAISYAAFRVLESRYIESTGASDTIPELDSLMAALCYPIDMDTAVGNSPAAVGNRIAAGILAQALGDGSNEADNYKDSRYEAVNPALIVTKAGAGAVVDPNRWQPLQLEFMISQNGIPIENGVQQFIGPHWGYVTPFALHPDPLNGLPLDPGPPPLADSEISGDEYKAAALEVIRFSSYLDPRNSTRIDISPASIGNNPLGTRDGEGYLVNPATGLPYEPNVVNRADFARSLAEFWADGPNSETPPGHWNTVANTVSDTLGDDLRVGGIGDSVDRLQWDVMMYLALNGANHDAAVAAWGAKGYYDYIRPISMIRWMGGLGQSSDPAGASYDARGLPLEDGLVELVTDESSATGQPHEHLHEFVGDVAILSYRGTPVDRETELGGVGWIRAVEWVPYQAPTFVTPSFAGYVSGHSTFSRAAAEVLTALTGSEYFPGGVGEYQIMPESLEFEAGPETSVTLQWATYRDAADQAGISRLYGGIHVRADDFGGRIMGAEIGMKAWEKARSYFGQLDDGS